MSDSTIAIDLNKTLDIEGNLTTELTFYSVVVFDLVTKLCDLIICKILRTLIGIDAGLSKDVLGALKTDTVNIGKSDFYALLIRDINT